MIFLLCVNFSVFSTEPGSSQKKFRNQLYSGYGSSSRKNAKHRRGTVKKREYLTGQELAKKMIRENKLKLQECAKSLSWPERLNGKKG